MIGWGALIGRMISFMLEKLVGKKIELAMDDRRRAARHFMQLYHTISDLEVLTKEIIVELCAMITEKDTSVSAEWLRNIAYAVDQTSERFLEATNGLRDILNIFDPPLASTMSDLEAHKFSFLIIATHGFEPVIEKGEMQEIKYTYPGERVSNVDLGEHYKWYRENFPLDNSKSLEWPEWVTLGFVEESDVEEGRLTIRDPGSMQRLADLLKNHSAALGVARKGLEKFLRERFTIEDLLSIREPVSQFDRIHAMNRMSDALAIPYTRFFVGKPMRRISRQEDLQGDNPEGEDRGST